VDKSAGATAAPMVVIGSVPAGGVGASVVLSENMSERRSVDVAAAVGVGATPGRTEPKTAGALTVGEGAPPPKTKSRSRRFGAALPVGPELTGNDEPAGAALGATLLGALLTLIGAAPGSPTPSPSRLLLTAASSSTGIFPSRSPRIPFQREVNKSENSELLCCSSKDIEFLNDDISSVMVALQEGENRTDSLSKLLIINDFVITSAL